MPSEDGPDVSEYQSFPDWDAFAAAYPNILLVVSKQTQGQTYVDRAARYNRDNLRRLVDAGWNSARTVPNPPVLGFYHFADQWNPDAQAQHFADVLGPVRPGEFVCVDAEPVTINGVVYIPQLSASFVCGLMGTIGVLFGRICVSYRGFYYEQSGDPAYANFPWWYPWYGVEQPPKDYGYGWMVHQYGGAPYVGITPGHDVDSNSVHDYPQLLANSMSGQPTPPPPTPPETNVAYSPIFQLADNPAHWSRETGFLPADKAWRRDPTTGAMTPWGSDYLGPFFHHLSGEEEAEKLSYGNLMGTVLLPNGTPDDGLFSDWAHDDNA